MKTRKRHGGIAFCSRENKLAIIVLVFALIMPWSGLLGSQPSELTLLAQQSTEQQKDQKIQAKAQPEKIVGGPKNIKERTAIHVFLGWLWVSIGVLIYVLRLKIKEADRLHAIKFFTPDRK